MKPTLGYVIFYVADVPATLAQWSRAFGWTQKFLHESNTYGELETGTTTLSFAAEAMLEIEFRKNRAGEPPAGAEVAAVVDDPHALYERAVAAGCVAYKALEQKPWGQISGFVRDPNGILVEICSPVSE